MAMGYAGATKASMLQDVERGEKTEVDVINGGLVERGREYGVETPLNVRIVELMHATERGERGPERGLRRVAGTRRLIGLGGDDAVGDLDEVGTNHVWLFDERVESLPGDEGSGATRAECSRHVPGVGRDEAHSALGDL